MCSATAGAFNDRVRDGAIGGSPFAPPGLQGLLTGLAVDPNSHTAPNEEDPQSTLRAYTDVVKLGMAGNLKEYSLGVSNGTERRGREIMFNGVPAGYCAQPSENVVYLGCHDNETLYDMVVLKANHGGSAEICARIAQLALGLIAVSQGVAFFHAGDDLLRSKSLDRDSYNSGDWFNRLLWDGSHNNFGVGAHHPASDESVRMLQIPSRRALADGLWQHMQRIADHHSVDSNDTIMMHIKRRHHRSAPVHHHTRAGGLAAREQEREHVAFEALVPAAAQPGRDA